MGIITLNSIEELENMRNSSQFISATEFGYGFAYPKNCIGIYVGKFVYFEEDDLKALVKEKLNGREE